MGQEIGNKADEPEDKNFSNRGCDRFHNEREIIEFHISPTGKTIKEMKGMEAIHFSDNVRVTGFTHINGVSHIYLENGNYTFRKTKGKTDQVTMVERED